MFWNEPDLLAFDLPTSFSCDSEGIMHSVNKVHYSNIEFTGRVAHTFHDTFTSWTTCSVDFRYVNLQNIQPEPKNSVVNRNIWKITFRENRWDWSTWGGNFLDTDEIAIQMVFQHRLPQWFFCCKNRRSIINTPGTCII
jgi:hypothetical protein